MVSTPSAGLKARTTTDATTGKNTDGCAWCPRPADGIEATTGLAVCRGCADALGATDTRLVTDGGESP
jgi:hypothetical protein